MRHIILFGSLLALTACNNSATESDAAGADQSAVATSDESAGSVAAIDESAALNPTDAASYVNKAGAGDSWEIASSKAVLDKTQNADVKKFAQMMIDHHSKSTEKLMAAAKAGKISAGPPQMDAMQQSMLDDVKNASASNVDATYLKHQQTAHNNALQLHQNFAQNGDNESLKKAAGETAKVVTTHITELQKLLSGANGNR